TVYRNTRRELGKIRETVTMTHRIRATFLLVVLGWLISATAVRAAEMTSCEAHLAHAASSQKTTYIMFYRTNDAATQAMHRTVKAHCDALGDKATWLNISLTNPAEATLISRFDA